VLTPLGLPFTEREECGITLLSVPVATVTERLRAKLRRLLKERGYGAAKQLADYSQTKTGARISTQELSYFLNDAPKRRGLHLDDLDDIAAFFRISIAELLGDTKIGDLSPDEQRMLYAVRVLNSSTREHFLALLEAAALGAHLAGTRRHTTSSLASPGVAHAQSSAPEPVLRAIVERFLNEYVNTVSLAADIGRQDPTPGQSGPVDDTGTGTHRRRPDPEG